MVDRVRRAGQRRSCWGRRGRARDGLTVDRLPARSLIGRGVVAAIKIRVMAADVSSRALLVRQGAACIEVAQRSRHQASGLQTVQDSWNCVDR